MIGVCIPAHNEEQYIDACLASVLNAANHPSLHGEPVHVVVVLDACSDATALRSRYWPVTSLHVNFKNVGLARAAGARYLIDLGVRWLAFTDADSRVSETWLMHQLSFNADVVCGTVEVTDWSAHGAFAKQAQQVFQAGYLDQENHKHVHGANLGVHPEAYLRVGGFDALTCSEDQALVDKLVLVGATIVWTALPRVTTSARPISRVEGGFATALRQAWETKTLEAVAQAPVELKPDH